MAFGKGALAAVAVLLAVPAPAAAHAGFVSSSPAPDAVIDVAPRQIVVRFNQAVRPSSLRLFDGVARPVPVGKASQPRPNEVAVPITAQLERGTYTAVWRVISDDVDPVNGFVTFHVGVKREPPPAAAAGGGGSSTPRLAVYGLLGLSVAAALGLAVVRRRLVVAAAVLAGGLALSTGLAVALDGDAEPARAEPFRAAVQMGELAGRIAVAPAALGANRIELALPRPTGAEGGYFEVRVRASLPAAGIGPFSFTGVQGDDPSRFSVRNAYLPIPGSWTLRVSARRGVDGRYAGAVTVPIE
jgi:methionine-rich copper-binding protein CopC